MRSSDVARGALKLRDNRIAGRAWWIVFAVGALLSACGGTSIPGLIANNGNTVGQMSTHKRTFVYTGHQAKFIVPSGITKLTIVADGAEGGGNTYGHYSEAPGYGGEVFAIVPVQAGEKLYVFVGGEGNKHDGYNGGGQGGSSEYGRGFYGGGASDVREGGQTLSDRILIAAGGGGAGGGYYISGAGGAGGAMRGGSGCCKYSSGSDNGVGGTGGSQAKGGAGGAGGGMGEHAGQPGDDGSRGIGGDGGASGPPGGRGYAGGEGGGGGGGGYFGGGGGGGGQPSGSCSCGGGYGGGGGGGSSYIESKAHKINNEQGVWTSDGVVTVSW